MNLQQLLLSGRAQNASDIHLIVGLPPIFRIHGDIVTSKGDTITPEQVKKLAYEKLNAYQIETLEKTFQLCFSIHSKETDRARVTIYFRNGNPELSIRLTEKNIRTRQELRLPEVIDDLARKQNGLVVISGPTGTGKTTTFNYMLDLINTERYCKIITIEDPIEYTHTAKRSIVVQQEVLTDVADFQGALKHVLRQDPDVIGVGEMRDRETIYTTLIAAETGHLVIATLHTPNTIALVQRIVSVFSEGQQSEIRQILASCLQGVIAQQLLPHISGKSLLLNTEILIATTAVRAHIRDNDLHLIYSEMQTGSKHKMVTFDRSLLELYQKAEITYDTAINMALHPNSIKERMA